MVGGEKLVRGASELVEREREWLGRRESEIWAE